MEIDICFGGDLSDLLHWLQHSCLIIRRHDRDQPGSRPQRPADIQRINQAPAIYGHIRDLAALRLQVLAGIQNGVMLDGRGNHVISGSRNPKNRQIIGLSATAGEHHLRGPATQQGSHGFARLLHCRVGLLSVMVNRRGIPKLLAEVRLHRLENLRQHGSGRAIVEIDSSHGILTADSILSCQAAVESLQGLKQRGSEASQSEES